MHVPGWLGALPHACCCALALIPVPQDQAISCVRARHYTVRLSDMSLSKSMQSLYMCLQVG